MTPTRLAATATTSKTPIPDRLLQRIRDGQRFLLSGHLSPDGDAIGSALGLSRILTKLGKSGAVWNRDPTPEIYLRLPGADRIRSGSEPPPGFETKFDAVITIECPNLDRTGLGEHLSRLPILNIDHHLGNEKYGEVNWVDTAAPALGEMIHFLGQRLNATIDSTVANNLLVALVSDTGGFRFSNATERAFEAAAALLRDGASPPQVSHWLYESKPLAAVRLLGEMITTLEFHASGAVATAVLTLDMFRDAGAEAADSEGLIDQPRSIVGVEAVALIRQLPAGGSKVSLRSRDRLDVEAVARRHGGGGHRNAAGFASDLEVEAARALVANELEEALHRS